MTVSDLYEACKDWQNAMCVFIQTADKEKCYLDWFAVPQEVRDSEVLSFYYDLRRCGIAILLKGAE